MNDYSKLQEDLSAYLDGELAPGRAEQVQRALADDPDLSAELDDLRAVRDLLAALPRARAPRDLADSVLHQAERSSLVATSPTEANRRPLRWIPYAAAASLLIAATTLGIMTYTQLWPNDAPPIAYTPPPRSEPDLTERRDTRGKPDTPGTGPAMAKVVDRHGKGGGAAGGAATNTGAGMQIAGSTPVDNKKFGQPDRYGKGIARGGRDGGFAKLGTLPEADVKEVIYTPTVAHTQRQIETFLTSNSIEPIVTASTATVPAKPRPKARGRGNHFRTFRVTANQVRIRIDAATPEQIERIRGEIEKIRIEQRVSQVAIPGEAIAYHRAHRPVQSSGKDMPKPVVTPADTPAPPARRAPAKPGGGTADDKAEQVADPGRGAGRKVGKYDSPRTDDRDKPAAKKGPDRPAEEGHSAHDDAGAGAGAQAGPKVTDEQREQRRTKGKSGPGDAKPGETDPSNAPPGTAVGAKETGTAKNTKLAAQVQDGQHQGDAEAHDPAKNDKGQKARADRQNRNERGFMGVLKSLFDGKNTGDKLAESAVSQPASRLSKAVTAPTSRPGGQPSRGGWDPVQVARQSQKPALQGQRKLAEGQSAGANVRAMVITLNFRSVTDAQVRQQIGPAETNKATTQTNESK